MKPGIEKPINDDPTPYSALDPEVKKALIENHERLIDALYLVLVECSPLLRKAVVDFRDLES